jgi:hypothetical protein
MPSAQGFRQTFGGVVLLAGILSMACETSGPDVPPGPDAAPPADVLQPDGGLRPDATSPVVPPECETIVLEGSACGQQTCGPGQACQNGTCGCITGTYGKNSQYTCDVLSSRGCVDGACHCSAYGDAGAGMPCGGRSRACRLGFVQDVCEHDGKCNVETQVSTDCAQGGYLVGGGPSGIAFDCPKPLYGNDGFPRLASTANGAFSAVRCAVPDVVGWVTDGTSVVTRSHVNPTDGGITGERLVACVGGGVLHELYIGSPSSPVVIGGGSAFWIESDSLRACALTGCGGVPKNLGALSNDAVIAADATAIFVAIGPRLLRIDPQSGDATELDGSDAGDAGPRTIEAIVPDGDTIWVAGSGSISTCARSGCAGARATFAPSGYARSLHVDATRAWWVDASGALVSCAKNAPCAAPSRALYFPGSTFAGDATHIYRANNGLFRYAKTALF